MLTNILYREDVFKTSQSLQFLDFVVLSGIISLSQKLKKPPTARDLIDHTNTFLSENKITEARSVPISSHYVFQSHIDKLRRFGFIVEGEDRTPYVITEKGEALFDLIGDQWKHWPVIVPVEKGELDFTEAVYL